MHFTTKNALSLLKLVLTELMNVKKQLNQFGRAFASTGRNRPTFDQCVAKHRINSWQKCLPIFTILVEQDFNSHQQVKSVIIQLKFCVEPTMNQKTFLVMTPHNFALFVRNCGNKNFSVVEDIY